MTTFSSRPIPETRHRPPSPAISRGALTAMGAVGLALLLVSLVLAANNFPSFPPAAEQIGPGQSYSGTYTDTHTANEVYRVLQETYITGTARTLADNPGEFTTLATYTDVIVFVPYTMPAEGGYIYRIAPYIFQTGTTRMRVALYAETDGVPRLLLAQSDVLTVSEVLTEPGWLWFDIPPQRIPGNTRYWLAYQADNDQALLGWKYASAAEEYRQRPWPWLPFPSLAGQTFASGTYRRTCFQIAYTATQYALDAAYTIPVTPALDAYTVTVRGGTSGEPFSVTADEVAVGTIVYSPTARTVFSDDMESGIGEWTADGFSQVVSGTGYYSSPEHAWWTDDVPYTSTAVLTSPVVAIPFSARDMELRFWMRMVSEFGWDGGWLEYRIGDENGDWSSWSEVPVTDIIAGHYNCLRGALAGCTGFHGVTGPHNGWSGSDLIGTIRVQVPLSATGRLIQWRWVFECDGIGGQPGGLDGWWIDDVRVVGTVSEDTVLVVPLDPALASDGQIVVRFQDTLTNTYPDLLGIDLIEVTGILYNRAPVVTVTLPNGGEYFSGTQTVTWTGLDVNGDVVTYNIYLSLDGGGTWSDSLYEVAYPESGTPSSHSWDGFNTTVFTDCHQCLIRITASDGEAQSYDVSDAPFIIDNTPPSVSLSAPNGGEFLRGGDTFTITWSASDANFGPSPIALAYSLDGGSSFTDIITATENDGEYPWILPAIDSSLVRVRVTATDRAGHSASDESDNFTIDSTPPDGTIAIAEGDYTRLREIHLILTAPDDTVQMYLDGDVENAANVRQWVAYTTAVTVTLSGGDGNKTVRVQYRDATGNTGNWAQALIIYDATPPVISDMSPADGSTVTTGTPVISATVRDATAGIDPGTITMTVDGVFVEVMYNGSTVSWTPDPPLANISHTVTLSAQDYAGNAASVTWEFAVNEPPATISLTANPPAIVADGVSTSTVSATVHSSSGHPVADGTEVVFTTTMGTLAGNGIYTATTQSGVAVAVLTAPTTDGVARVTARAGSAEASIEVLFTRYRVYLPLVMRGSSP